MRRSAWPLTLVVGLLALAAEVTEATGGSLGERIQATLAADRFAEAETLSREALRWYPYHTGNLHARLMALGGLGRWNDAMAAAEGAAAWDMDGANLWRLAGEAAYSAGRDEPAARMLWKSFWRNPAPRYNAATLWDVALVAGRRAWGDRDPRVLAAALRVVTLAGGDPKMDPGLDPAIRRRALADAAAALEAAGAPQSAEAAKMLIQPPLE